MCIKSLAKSRGVVGAASFSTTEPCRFIMSKAASRVFHVILAFPNEIMLDKDFSLPFPRSTGFHLLTQLLFLVPKFAALDGCRLATNPDQLTSRASERPTALILSQQGKIASFTSALLRKVRALRQFGHFDRTPLIFLECHTARIAPAGKTSTI